MALPGLTLHVETAGSQRDSPVKDTTLAATVDIDPDAAPVKAPGGATMIDVKAVLNTVSADTFAALGAGLRPSENPAAGPEPSDSGPVPHRCWSTDRRRISLTAT
ncbi:hypothetical protein GCM10022223_45500 [Kineosporia mesophila]|uniref:Uncharacterized protein n=1 Tax=Kineosporia mesophila TaxID=566012 RepID=A0ABP7A240_9ACTN